MLLVAEYYAANLFVRHARIHVVHPGTSYQELADGILSGKVSLSQVKVLVLLIGRSDVLNCQRKVQESLRRVEEAVEEVNPGVIGLVATPPALAFGSGERSQKIIPNNNYVEGVLW